MAVQGLWCESTHVARGDIFQLGHHRLMCGNSTNGAEVGMLMAGAKVTAVVTDPPYGIIHAEWDTVTLGFVDHLGAVSEETATCVLFCTLPFGFTLHNAMLEAGYQWRWDSVWTKVSGGFRVSSHAPRPAHEHLFAYARRGIKPSDLIFNGWDAGEKEHPWQKTNGSGQGDTKEVYRRVFQPVSAGQEDGQRWIRSVIPGKEKPVMPVRERTAHPTQKPLEVVTKLVLLLSHVDNVVYDPFLGSGTSLLACEQTGRRCYGMELSSEYCELIIQRWQQSTGQKPVKVHDGYSPQASAAAG